MQADTIVLGAGIVGVSIAIHLAERGQSVILVDRRGPGEETSFGNAGLLQREGVVPHAFPQDVPTILRHAWNNSIDSSYHVSVLPRIAPFLARYFWHSRPHRHKQIQKLYEPLIANSLREHAALIEKANAGHLIKKGGWLKTFRSAEGFDKAATDAEKLFTEFGLPHELVCSEKFASLEPDFQQRMAGAIHWASTWSVIDPHNLILRYTWYFESLGGTFCKLNVTDIEPQKAGGWQVKGGGGQLSAAQLVVALGPWAGVIGRKLGYRLPLIGKRGYHMHYQPKPGARLNNPVFDAEAAYMLSPMAQGIRLTTGIEFARHDAAPSPVQLERAEHLAWAASPIGERIDAAPWLGARPCTPDMLPLIGKAPRHEGLWFGAGHGHHGLTLGPVTGRIIAELMTNEKPIVDPYPYRLTRFLI